MNLITEEYNLGTFQEVKNKDSDQQYFKIGFTVKISDIEDPFQVYYSFVNGTKIDIRFQENAIFESMEVLTNKGNVFFGIYYMTDMGQRPYSDIKLPSDEGDTSIIRFRLNNEILSQYISKITKSDFSDLMAHLSKISYNDGYWWGECFRENEYCFIDYDVSPFNFSDFEHEMEYDYFFNLAGYDLKDALYYGTCTDNERDMYSDILEQIHFLAFIREVIHPILEGVKVGCEIFYSNNILHIQPDLSQDRLIIKDKNSDYLVVLLRLLPKYLEFVRKSLEIFGIDGIIEILPHLNSAFEINLITGAKKVVEDQRSPIFTIEPSYEFYATNPRVNIADLGKGTSNLIKLILKTLSILINIEEEKVIKERIPKDQGRKKEMVIKKTILIEEPEVFLHPNWQSGLVNFFTLCLNQFEVQFIVETHSVYLVQKLQTLVAKGNFNPQKATLLYFNSCEEDDKYYEISIRKDGILKERFGTGFYDQTAILTADILNASRIN